MACAKRIGRPKCELTGRKVGRLKVIEEAGRDKHGSVMWKCVCDCGQEKVFRGTALARGHSRSCGCLKRDELSERNKTHGKSGSPEYVAWTNMIARCEYLGSSSYYNYGARGISVCKRWRESFEAFYEDMGPRPGRHYTLERLDNSKGYNPKNCEWVTVLENNRNKRPHPKNNTRTCGVTRTKNGRYQAVICANYKFKYLGRFDTKEEAVAARKAAEKALWGRTTNPQTS